MRKLLLTLVGLLTCMSLMAAGGTDKIPDPTKQLNYGNHAITGTTTGVKYDFNQVYGNYSSKNANDCNYQLTQTKKSYITNTSTSGNIRTIKFKLIAGQAKVYVNNKPYTAYGSTTPAGTLVSKETTTGVKTLTVEGDYSYFYIAANNSSALRINNIEFTWEDGGSTPAPETVETPTITPKGGEVEAGYTITFDCATDGVTYHYAWDGGTETTGASTTAQAGTLSVYATKDGMNQSAIATAIFTIKSAETETVVTPIITPNGGEVDAGSTITFACATEGVTYHYAWNGGTETTGASTTAQAGTLSVYATKNGMNQSAPATADFTIKSQGGDVDGWKLVTSASELEVGARYIIVAKNSSTYMGMGNAAAVKERNAVQITVSNNVVSNEEVTSKALMTFKLGQGATGTYTWLAENYQGTGEYLSPKNGKTDLNMSDTPVSLYVELNGNLVAIRDSNKSGYARAVTYSNDANKCFKNYSISQNSSYLYPSLYKWTGKEVVVAPSAVTFTPETGKEFTVGSKAVVTVKADTDCKLYYSLEGEATAESAEYDAATGIVLATDMIGKEYNVSVLAVNETGQCTGSATYTIIDKKHVAPTSIVIRESEGNYEAGAELTVSLAADTKAYPAPELFYTIDGRAANDGKATPYTEPFTLVEREGHKTVTVNAYAVNDAGDCVASAMYIFGANKVDAGDPNKWSLVTNVAQLNDGDEVLIVSNKYGKALSTNQKGNNRGNTSVTLNETKDEISTVTGDAQVIVLNNTADGWTLKTNNYTDKDGNAVESGYLFTLGTSGSYLRTNAELYEVPETEGAASSHAEISIMSNGAATIAFKTVGDSNKYLNYNNNSGSGLFSCYRPDYGTPTSPNYSATSQYDAPHFYKKGGFRYEDVEEFYLVMPVNEYTGRHELYPFVYKGVENGEHLYEVSVSYIGGEFYVRDGRANNSGTYFGSSVEQDAQTASALRANVANNVVPIVSEKSEYTLIHKPAADTHTMFTTHVGEESNAIENATFTMVYTPGSHTDGKLRVKALVLTGIENVGADVEGAVEYFNLQGMRISEPVKGQVVIRRQGAKVEKIAVR